MLGNTYKTAQSFHTQAFKSRKALGTLCNEVKDILDRIGGENYCPYEDLEEIHEKLQKMTD